MRRAFNPLLPRALLLALVYLARADEAALPSSSMTALGGVGDSTASFGATAPTTVVGNLSIDTITPDAQVRPDTPAPSPLAGSQRDGWPTC